MIYAVICTRDANQITKTFSDLLAFYVECGIKPLVFSGQQSIFSAYKQAVEQIDPDPLDDIIIFCHDDIEIDMTKEQFLYNLREYTMDTEIGFVGPAGTTYLGQDAVWWNHDNWKMGLHRGCVYHVNAQGHQERTYYGEPGQVVVLDGLFLACRGHIARNLWWDKPEGFPGDWDFYDIYYTYQAHTRGGKKNLAMPMQIIHHSRGELAGRDSWHLNRAEFISKATLPMGLDTKKTL